MLCDKCRQREAKVYYTEIVNGKKKEQHLCERCASECSSFQEKTKLLNSDMSISGLLAAIFETMNKEKTSEQVSEQQESRCKSCGMTYQNFTECGKFGCAECYDTFRPIIHKTLKGIQGSSNHTGKHPKQNGNITNASGKAPEEMISRHDMTQEEQMKVLSLELQKAVHNEEYEEAAKLRDELRAMKAKSEEQKNKDKQSIDK